MGCSCIRKETRERLGRSLGLDPALPSRPSTFFHGRRKSRWSVAGSSTAAKSAPQFTLTSLPCCVFSMSHFQRARPPPLPKSVLRYSSKELRARQTYCGFFGRGPANGPSKAIPVTPFGPTLKRPSAKTAYLPAARGPTLTDLTPVVTSVSSTSARRTPDETSTDTVFTACPSTMSTAAS